MTPLLRSNDPRPGADGTQITSRAGNKEHEIIVKPFAFYGRVSTEDQQDPASSRAWQLRRALELIEPGGGAIVAEFFDVVQSRSLPWKRRPEASRLLDLLRSADRGFVAVAIGEPQRAFYGAQFALTFPLFEHYGVELWVPEVGGRVDPGSEQPFDLHFRRVPKESPLLADKVPVRRCLCMDGDGRVSQLARPTAAAAEAASPPPARGWSDVLDGDRQAGGRASRPRGDGSAGAPIPSTSREARSQVTEATRHRKAGSQRRPKPAEEGRQWETTRTRTACWSGPGQTPTVAGRGDKRGR